MTSPGLPPRARPVAAAGVRALRRGPRRLVQALTGRKSQGLPSTRAEATGVRAAGAPAGARSACAAGGRDTPRRHAWPHGTTRGPVTADARILTSARPAG